MATTPAKVVGRKRYIALDTDGRLLIINLTSADIRDSAGAEKVLDAVKQRWPWLKHWFADSAYDRVSLMDKAALLDFVVEVMRKLRDQHGFVPLPRRWVVERTFGWMMNWCRLVRDDEKRVDISEELMDAAMGSLILKRLFDQNQFSIRR